MTKVIGVDSARQEKYIILHLESIILKKVIM